MKNLEVSNKEVKEVKEVQTNKSTLESINLDKLNFDKLEKKITVKSKIEEKNSINNDTEIYKYSEEQKTNENKRKSFRNKLRKNRIKFENDILKFYTENNNVELLKSLKLFLSFYKENYITNDFSLYSIIKNNTDTDKMKKTDEFLKVVKELLQLK